MTPTLSESLEHLDESRESRAGYRNAEAPVVCVGPAPD